MSSSRYLLAGQVSELERLQLQSRVWEPAGRRLLEEIGDGGGARAVDIGCGVMGWLRLLSGWVGADGEVVGTAAFDLLHARFVLTPLGRGHEQLETYLRLLRPGGVVVLEDPDWGSWHFNPPAERARS